MRRSYEAMRRPLAAALLALSLVAVACATPSSAGAGNPDAAGEGLYRGHCASCHRLRDPSEETRDRWAWAVDRFGPRAHLSPGERALVLAYLKAHARDAAPAPEVR